MVPSKPRVRRVRPPSVAGRPDRPSAPLGPILSREPDGTGRTRRIRSTIALNVDCCRSLARKVPGVRHDESCRRRLDPTAIIRHMDDNADRDQILTSGAGATVGSFRLLFAEQRWEWSDAVAAMHGYAPGEIAPTTELILAHKHPDDKIAVTENLERTLQTGVPFSSSHRIIDTSGRVHHVVVVGARLLEDVTGEVIGTSGFYIDVSDRHRDDVQAALDEALPELVRARAAIEQAKGA